MAALHLIKEYFENTVIPAKVLTKETGHAIVLDQSNSLFGNSILDQATIEMWHRMVEFQGLFPAMQAFRNITGLYKDRENVVLEWGIESKKRVISFFLYLISNYPKILILLVINLQLLI